MITLWIITILSIIERKILEFYFSISFGPWRTETCYALNINGFGSPATGGMPMRCRRDCLNPRGKGNALRCDNCMKCVSTFLPALSPDCWYTLLHSHETGTQALRFADLASGILRENSLLYRIKTSTAQCCNLKTVANFDKRLRTINSLI